VEVAGSTVQNCQTGADANQRADCRIVGVVNSVQDYWGTELPRRGVRYAPADTVFFTGQTDSGLRQGASPGEVPGASQIGRKEPATQKRR